MSLGVLQLINSFHIGGSESQAIQLTRLLHESRKYRVHAACLDPTGPLRADIERLEIGEIPAFPLQRFYDVNAWRQILRLARYLRAHKIEIIQTSDYYTNIFGMFAAALARTPIRVAARRRGSVHTGARRGLEHFAYRLAHRVVANSEITRQELIQEGIRPEKVVVIYNGLEQARVIPPRGLLREEARAALGLPQIRPLITVTANLRPEKNHVMFLHAAARIHSVMPETAFALAGEGERQHILSDLATKLGIGADTFFLGQCHHIATLLLASDMCALSSRTEGFSNAILEYMAAALPVVATDVGGAREAIEEGKTGYLVPSGDDETMASRLLTLLANPSGAKEMGIQGRCVIAERFSTEARLKRTLALYQELLAER